MLRRLQALLQENDLSGKMGATCKDAKKFWAIRRRLDSSMEVVSCAFCCACTNRFFDDFMKITGLRMNFYLRQDDMGIALDQCSSVHSPF